MNPEKGQIKDGHGCGLIKAITDSQTNEEAVESVRKFLLCGANVDEMDEEGTTALMYASIIHNPEIVKLLLEHGSDVNARNRDGETALSLALFEQPSSFILWRHVKVWLSVFDSSCFEPSEGRLNANIIATVRLLLDAGADANARNKYNSVPLVYAAAYYSPYSSPENMIKLFRIILEHGADINAKSGKVVGDSIRRLNITGGSTALMMVSYSSNMIKTLQYLLDSGANVNDADDHGTTPLMKTVAKDDEDEVIKVFLDAGANVNQTDNNGRNALMIASGQHHDNAVRILLEHGTDTKLKDKEGKTALDWASSEGTRWDEMTETIRLIRNFEWEREADINI